MSWSWAYYAAYATQFLPLLAAIWARQRLDTARKGALVWACLLLATNVLALGVALTHRNNLWIGYTINPLLAAVGLWTLAQWQVHSLSRFALQLLIPLYLLSTILLTLTVEDLGDFSRVTGPFTSLLLLGVSLYTVSVRSLEEATHLHGADWFWIGMALALFYGSDAALGPFARVLLRDRPDLVMAAYNLRAVIAVLVSFALARGFLCPSPPMISGGSSSPRSSRSSSSLSPSAWRS